MVKKRSKGPKTHDDINDTLLVDPTTRSFIYDEVDDYNDNDDDFDMKDDDLSDDNRKEQVLGIGGYSSEESNDTDDDLLANDDIQSNHEDESDDQNAEREMGNKKKFFFGTDLTDERIHNATKMKNRKRGNSALQLEMEGAKQLQERMRKEMSQGLYSVQLFSNSTEDETLLPEKTQNVESDTTVASTLAKKPKKSKKVRGVGPTAPLADMREKAKELANKLSPLMEAKKKGLLPNMLTTEYLEARYLLCLNYLSVVSAYMMVKSSGEDMAYHPAQARLAQYKHLFSEMEPCREKCDPELDDLLSKLPSLQEKEKKRKRKMLGVVMETKKAQEKGEDAVMREEEEEEEGGGRLKEQPSDPLSSEDEDAEDTTEMVDTGTAAEARRKISKQISKNKGLLPSRKRDQRNPRVRYKNKYKTKLKRRKGQVREVRREIERYGGEISGIKKNTIKSIKLK